MTTHAPGRLPQITLNSRDFYIRSGSLSHAPIKKDVSDSYGMTGARRRTVFSGPREWSFTVACRCQDDKTFIQNLVNDASYASYTVEFQDGVTDATYNVIVQDVAEFTPIHDNLDFNDVAVRLIEWS